MPTSPLSSRWAYTNRDIYRPEQVAQHVTRRWFGDGAIFVHSVSSPSRYALDAWLDAVLELAQSWPLGQPYLAVHDLSESNIQITPYTTRRIVETFRAIPDGLMGRSALVVPNNLVYRFARSFVVARLTRQNESIEREFFFSVDEAVEWCAAAVTIH